MQRQRPKTQLLAILLIISLVITQTGCMKKPPGISLHEQLLSQRIALVPDRSAIDVSLKIFSKSRPEGALKGVGEGVVEMLSSLSGGSCSGDVCGAALLFYLAFAVVVGGTVGAMSGAIKATPENMSENIETFMDTLLNNFASHLKLTKKVFLKSREVPGVRVDFIPLEGRRSAIGGQEISQLADKGYQKIFTVKLSKFGFESIGHQARDPSLALILEADVSIINSNSNIVDYGREFRVLSKARRYSEWLKLNPEALSSEVDTNLDLLATHIVDSLFIAYNLPVDSGSWSLPGTAEYGCCWICPITPPLKIDYFPILSQQWSYVTSLKPRLEWGPFPNKQRQAQFRENTGHEATNVNYDLKVWEMIGGEMGELFYERYALPAVVHQVEDSLKPRAKYLWSIRACFDLDKKKACTPWSFSLVPSGPDACESTTIKPEINYYRFITP